MRHTANETSTTTLTRLIRSLDAKHPVTITYIKADGSETLRTIEIFNVIVSQAGDTTESRTVGLATVTVLYPVDCPATARVQLLADALAA
jgi:hypothetical protein